MLKGMPSSRPRQTVARDFDAQPSPTCAKTLAVLESVARHPDGMTGAGVVRETKVTPNLAFRILKTLVGLGYCRQDPTTKTYSLTGKLLDLVGPRADDRSLAVVSHESIVRLRDATGETAQLVIESEGKTLVLDQVQGVHAIQVCGRLGMRAPLYSCAPGKAILAWWSETRRDEWFRGHTLKQFTATTLTDRSTLDAELAESRGRGFTVDRAEGLEGIHCVAAPILDTHGQPLAAVTIMAPVFRLPESAFAAVADHCITAARGIEAGLHS
jgi:DNA-binding IclR family transcriptional regulator